MKIEWYGSSSLKSRWKQTKKVVHYYITIKSVKKEEWKNIEICLWKIQWYWVNKNTPSPFAFVQEKHFFG